MSLRFLKWLTVLLPPFLIGGFEIIRHEFLLEHLSMETGNYYITLLTLILSYVFATWMFRTIRVNNERLTEEQAKRAVYEERERLAQELHDHIAQILFFLNVSLKQGKLDSAREAVSEIDNHLRQAIFNLRSDPGEGFSLPVRIQRWIDNWRQVAGIEVESRIEVEIELNNPQFAS